MGFAASSQPVEAAKPMQIELPEQAGGNGAPRPPFLGAADQLACAWPMDKPIQTLDRKLQAKVVGGPDVWPAKRKKQIDLGCPSPDALELYQFRQHFLVR